MVFTGCAKKTDPQTIRKVKQKAASIEGASTEEPEEITVMIWDRGDAAPGTTIEDNALTTSIQEQVLAATNVKVNYQAVSRYQQVMIIYK